MIEVERLLSDLRRNVEEDGGPGVEQADEHRAMLMRMQVRPPSVLALGADTPLRPPSVYSHATATLANTIRSSVHSFCVELCNVTNGNG